MAPASLSYSGFVAVAISAKHLAVFCNRLSSQMPRCCYMVSVHLIQRIMYFSIPLGLAEWTCAVLLLISLLLHTFYECSDIQMPLVSRQNISIDALFVHHIVVYHQPLNFFLEPVWIQFSILIDTPINPFHFFTLNGENCLYSLN